MFRHLGQVRLSLFRGRERDKINLGMERLEMRSAPFTSCLLPGSGLGGQAFLAAVSWVRKEEKSHILWWLYPLGSLPKTLVTEQTVEPSGGRGRDRGPADPAQTGGGEWNRQRGGPRASQSSDSDSRAQGGDVEREMWGKINRYPVSTWVIRQHSPAASSYAFLSHWAGRESEG